MGPGRSHTDESVAVKPRIRVEKPSMFKVLLHNDHYTTMEFVVRILETIFGKRGPEAIQIMLNVHENGVGVAGIYTSEIAETKIGKVHSAAEQAGFPLMCTMEPQ